MATLEELEAKRKRIDEQIREKKRALSKQERTAENHAKLLAGGMLLAKIGGGDWKRCDFEALSEYIDRYGYAISKCSCDAQPLDGAKKRLRNWERDKRPWDSWQTADGDDERDAGTTESGPEAVEKAGKAEGVYLPEANPKARACPICGRTYPYTKEYWADAGDGRWVCKDCAAKGL